MRKALFLLIAALAPAQAFAANQVALDNNVFVERVTTDAAGKQRVLLEEPKVVVPGDRLVFVLNYRNAGAQPADKFVITNPMPSAVRFAGAGDTPPLVSVEPYVRTMRAPAASARSPTVGDRDCPPTRIASNEVSARAASASPASTASSTVCSCAGTSEV